MSYNRGNTSPPPRESMTIFDLVEGNTSEGVKNNDQRNSIVLPLTAKTGSNDCVTLFVGPKGGGKTTLIQQFLGKTAAEGVKTTTALEYQFARRLKPGSTTEKEISHLWELGGSVSPSCGSSLVTVPLVPHLPRSTVCIVLDGSDYRSCIPNLTRWITTIQSRLTSSLDSLGEDSGGEEIRRLCFIRSQNLRLPQSHPDFSKVNPFPVPLFIALNKYDVSINNLQPKERKILLLAIRFIAHWNGCTIVETSFKDKQARDNWKSKARQRFFPVKGELEEVKEIGEGEGNSSKEDLWKKSGSISDSTGPISIKFGYDTFDSICGGLGDRWGGELLDRRDGSVKKGAMDTLNKIVTECLSGRGGGTSNNDSETWDKLETEEEDTTGLLEDYPCPPVDEAREGRDAKLRDYKKEVERMEEIRKNTLAVEGGENDSKSKSKGERGDREKRRNRK